jgi:light-regulated signal transduction histidine kinase (bacteriophytochrome)
MLVLELVITRGERLADLNADLTRSNEELDAFAYVASHDLKEPLRGIHRYAHQLLESAQTHANRGDAADGEGLRRVQSLMRLTLRMDSLLESLLHFSRVGRMELEFEAADLNTVVADALEMVGAPRSGSFDGKAGNTLSGGVRGAGSGNPERSGSPSRIDIPRRLPVVHCDPVRVCEVYSNLLTNALKYKRQDEAHIELGYIGATEVAERPNAPAASAGQDIFYVRDQGIGIDKRHHEQVFRLFKRMHGQGEYGGGVGAGLTIVQKVVHRHGGRVWIDSALGVGSTFYFTLPGIASGPGPGPV